MLINHITWFFDLRPPELWEMVFSVVEAVGYDIFVMVNFVMFVVAVNNKCPEHPLE